MAACQSRDKGLRWGWALISIETFGGAEEIEGFSSVFEIGSKYLNFFFAGKTSFDGFSSSPSESLIT
jgi:hypothetical protein